MSNEALIARVDAALAPMRARRPGLGVVVGVMTGGAAAVRAAGRVRSFQRHAVDERTIFEIGSLTKLFTGALLAVAAREGALRLDEPVGALLPGLRGPASELTLLRLATHTAGLPRLPRNLLWRSWLRHPLDPYRGYSDAALRAAVAAHRGRPPREPVEASPVLYSNFGMGLLGTAVAARLGVSFEDAVTARVCGPLGLADTRVTLTGEQRGRFAQGHNSLGVPTPHWRMPALEGAGALRSTTGDLLRFAAANLGRAPEPLHDALRDARHVRVATRAADGRLAVGMGLGWHAFETVGSRHLVHWHNGATYGARSFMAVVPALDLAVVALANRGLGIYDAIARRTTLDRVALQVLRDTIAARS